VAVSLSVATHQGSLPVAYRLYLPKEADNHLAGRQQHATNLVVYPMASPPGPRRRQAERACG